MADVRILDGAAARPLVDPFYERSGGRRCARDEDLFFLAMQGETLLGCVRYCLESGTPMLRTMMVDSGHRRSGIGSSLLNAFTRYLDLHEIHSVYCLPYAHLDAFYCKAGFERVSASDVPGFLRDRMQTYDPSGKMYLFMRRP